MTVSAPESMAACTVEWSSGTMTVLATEELNASAVVRRHATSAHCVGTRMRLKTMDRLRRLDTAAIRRGRRSCEWQRGSPPASNKPGSSCNRIMWARPARGRIAPPLPIRDGALARVVGEMRDEARELLRAVKHGEVPAALDTHALGVGRVRVAERLRGLVPGAIGGPHAIAEDGEQRRAQMAHAQRNVGEQLEAEPRGEGRGGDPGGVGVEPLALRGIAAVGGVDLAQRARIVAIEGVEPPGARVTLDLRL